MSKTLILHGYGQQVSEVKKKWSRTFKKIGLTDIHYLPGPLPVTNRKNEPGQVGSYGRTTQTFINAQNITPSTTVYTTYMIIL